MGRVFSRFRGLVSSLQRSRDTVFGNVSSLFEGRAIDDGMWEELEALLIQGDVGVDLSEELVKRVRERVRAEGVVDPAQAREILKREMIALLRRHETAGHVHGGLRLMPGYLTVVLVVGVNGAGKTTNIAKLAQYLKESGRRVVVAAADTFRAAAIDQLKIWGERADVPVIAHAPGADPAAVVFDAWKHARAVHADVLLIDTAGRLHTKFNLMEELKKVNRVLARQDEKAPHEVLLVLDATSGQNAVVQAREFQKAVGVTGIVLAKLDGTSKGGVAFSIADELRLPIRFVGTGEKIADIDTFDPEEFVRGLFAAHGQAA
ncbi:MAG: signal recognition particle-docking protein FtsY [Chloroflexota bacterium]|nr:MAG: signal recognition particle-docking protein FtsY [Chloroflexota bacterium]